MNDSDFTIGFRQGQEHGRQIMLEKIEDIKAEIYNIYVGDRSGYEVMADVLAILDKYISGKDNGG